MSSLDGYAAHNIGLWLDFVAVTDFFSLDKTDTFSI